MSETPESRILPEKEIKAILEYERGAFEARLKWIFSDRVEFLAKQGIPAREARVHTARAAALATVDFAGENTQLPAENSPTKEDS